MCASPWYGRFQRFFMRNVVTTVEICWRSIERPLGKPFFCRLQPFEDNGRQRLTCQNGAICPSFNAPCLPLHESTFLFGGRKRARPRKIFTHIFKCSSIRIYIPLRIINGAEWIFVNLYEWRRVDSIWRWLPRRWKRFPAIAVQLVHCFTFLIRAALVRHCLYMYFAWRWLVAVLLR